MHEQRLAKTRELLEEIRAQIEDFCEEHCAVEPQT